MCNNQLFRHKRDFLREIFLIWRVYEKDRIYSPKMFVEVDRPG